MKKWFKRILVLLVFGFGYVSTIPMFNLVSVDRTNYTVPNNTTSKYSSIPGKVSPFPFNTKTPTSRVFGTSQNVAATEKSTVLVRPVIPPNVNNKDLIELIPILNDIAILKYLQGFITKDEIANLVYSANLSVPVVQGIKNYFTIDYKGKKFELWESKSSRSQAHLDNIFDDSEFIRPLVYSFRIETSNSTDSNVFNIWHVHEKAQFDLRVFQERDFDIDEMKKIATDLIRLVDFLYKNEINPSPFIEWNRIVFDDTTNFRNTSDQVLKAVDLRYSEKIDVSELVDGSNEANLEHHTQQALDKVGQILQSLSQKRKTEARMPNVISSCDYKTPSLENLFFRSVTLSDLIFLLRRKAEFWVSPTSYLSHYFLTDKELVADFECVPFIPEDDIYGPRPSCSFEHTGVHIDPCTNLFGDDY